MIFVCTWHWYFYCLENVDFATINRNLILLFILFHCLFVYFGMKKSGKKNDALWRWMITFLLLKFDQNCKWSIGILFFPLLILNAILFSFFFDDMLFPMRDSSSFNELRHTERMVLQGNRQTKLRKKLNEINENEINLQSLEDGSLRFVFLFFFFRLLFFLSLCLVRFFVAHSKKSFIKLQFMFSLSLLLVHIDADCCCWCCCCCRWLLAICWWRRSFSFLFFFWFFFKFFVCFFFNFF